MTIEERAREDGEKAMRSSKGLDETAVIKQPNGIIFNGIPEYVGNVAAQAYIHGATDQQKIDIDKACKWLEDHSMVEWVLFRKAMEEEE